MVLAMQRHGLASSQKGKTDRWAPERGLSSFFHVCESDDVSRAGEMHRYGLTPCQKANADKEEAEKGNAA